MFARKGGQLADDEMCAWDERRDTCTRDLGGPLNVKINGRYHVVALNSFVKVAVSFVECIDLNDGLRLILYFDLSE